MSWTVAVTETVRYEVEVSFAEAVVSGEAIENLAEEKYLHDPDAYFMAVNDRHIEIMSDYKRSA